MAVEFEDEEEDEQDEGDEVRVPARLRACIVVRERDACLLVCRVCVGYIYLTCVQLCLVGHRPCHGPCRTRCKP